MEFFRKMILVVRIMVPKQRVLSIANFCWACQKCLENASTIHLSDGPKVRNIHFGMPQDVGKATEKDFSKKFECLNFRLMRLQVGHFAQCAMDRFLEKTAGNERYA